VYLLASGPLILLTLMGWEHGAYLATGVAALLCLGLAVWPLRLGAAVLFWPFAAGACWYGVALLKDVAALMTDGAVSVLLDADDSIVFVLLELVLIAVSALFFRMWRPRRSDSAAAKMST
jgi:hypothetical protein